jgi:hypothetical protein
MMTLTSGVGSYLQPTTATNHHLNHHYHHHNQQQQQQLLLLQQQHNDSIGQSRQVAAPTPSSPASLLFGTGGVTGLPPAGYVGSVFSSSTSATGQPASNCYGSDRTNAGYGSSPTTIANGIATSGGCADIRSRFGDGVDPYDSRIESYNGSIRRFRRIRQLRRSQRSGTTSAIKTTHIRRRRHSMHNTGSSSTSCTGITARCRSGISRRKCPVIINSSRYNSNCSNTADRTAEASTPAVRPLKTISPASAEFRVLAAVPSASTRRRRRRVTAATSPAADFVFRRRRPAVPTTASCRRCARTDRRRRRIRSLGRFGCDRIPPSQQQQQQRITCVDDGMHAAAMQPLHQHQHGILGQLDEARVWSNSRQSVVGRL